jgi:hypothetical protein
VPDLLGADPEDQVAVLAGQMHVPALEHVLHRNGDLPVLAAQNLLELARVHGVRLVRGGFELQLLAMEEHPRSSSCRLDDARITSVPVPKPIRARRGPKGTGGSSARSRGGWP